MHKIIIRESVTVPEDGLILGNGDISVSVYQCGGGVVFRLGKGDVWDTRLQLDKNPKPAHIAELTDMLATKGLSCKALGSAVSNRNALSARQNELCNSMPAILDYPYPCPKPVGELVLHYPADFRELQIRQTLQIEDGRIELLLKWGNGVTLKIGVVIHPELNRLAIQFKMHGLTHDKRYGGEFYGIPEPFPVYFSLFRKPDPRIADERRRLYRINRHGFLAGCDSEEISPLPAPEYLMHKDYAVLKQTFPEDNRFSEGFEYAVCVSGSPGFKSVIEENTIFMLPSGIETYSGELSAGIASTPEKSVRKAVEVASSVNFASDSKAARKAARLFWEKSSFVSKDKFYEKLWYSTLHIKRCVFKAGKIPPGLFLPSTIGHFSLWHGDYHTNYNIQSNFLGDYDSNHIETGDAFFEALAGQIELGRKIARDYYNCRGVFIQLGAFPFIPSDDSFGGLPFGRMAYMTGWVAAYFYRRWRFTLDIAWLKKTGYPALKEFALFYTDFLKQGADGFYHAYPSQQGESDFSKEECYDQPQVLLHARYALYCAAESANALTTDPELVRTWRRIISRMPYTRNANVPGTPVELAPEFCGFDGKEPERLSAIAVPGTKIYDWYNGHLHYHTATALRRKCWDPGPDFALLKKNLEHWVCPNGILTAMAKINYGNPGAWTESLGVIGVINDMLIQSWSGIIELFPGWPHNIDVRFRNLRAEGAFLISAGLKNEKLTKLSIHSEKGSLCRIKYGDKTIELKTVAGKTSNIHPAEFLDRAEN